MSIASHLPEGAKRVQQFLFEVKYVNEVQLLPESTATAKQAAETLGVRVKDIGKSIVFGNALKAVVAVLPGDKKVNAANLAALLEVENLSTLNADQVKEVTGFNIGGVSPFALPKEISIVIDSSLLESDVCFVAAGHPKAVVKTSANDIVSITKAIVGNFSV